MSQNSTPGRGRGTGSANESSDAKQLMLYDVNKKSMLVAYVLWFFLGGIGIHRFYLGHTGSAWAMIALCVLGIILAVVGIGVLLLIALGIWLLVDLFLIPGMVNALNAQVMARIEHGTIR